MAFETVLRRWGNSVGVIFPRNVIKSKHLHVNERLLIEVVKEADLRKAFGTLKAKTSGQEFKDSVREGWK